MNDIDEMLAKQFLLRVRQEGYLLVQNPPRSLDGINIDIYRGKTKICTFDDRQLGEKWNLRVRTDDSTREEIKQDYNKIFYMYIYLRDLYMVYDAAAPLQGYDHSLEFRAIMQHNDCTLAVKSYKSTGELEFGTFKTGINYNSYGNRKNIRDNIYFDMDNYPSAKLDFVLRSGLLPKEQLITPENIKYIHGSCSKTMAKEGGLFDEDTSAALGQIITDLEKLQDSFRDVEYRVSAIPALNAQYIESKIFAVKGLFTKQQVDRSTLPKGLFAYDVEYSRDKFEPERLWNKIIGHRFGMVITKKPLPIGEKGYTEFKDKDFFLNPEKRFNLKEFQIRHKEHER